VADRQRGLGAAFALYSLLRLGVFAVCSGAAAAVVLPLTGSGQLGSRLLACALVGAVVSIPVSLVLGRGLRADVAAGLERSRVERAGQREDYDARVRAVRAPHSDTGDQPPAGRLPRPVSPSRAWLDPAAARGWDTSSS